MKVQRSPIRKSVAVVTAWCLFLSSGGPFLGQTSTPPQTAARTASPPAATPAANNTVDGGWPRSYITPSGSSLILYQPQIASWEDQKNIVLYSAVAYTPKGGKRTLGTVKTTAATSISTEERLVSYSDVKVDEANFPMLEKPQLQEIVTQISTSIPSTDGVIALDRVLSNLDKSQIIPKNIEGVKADPPTIFFSKTPAVLVNLDGEPIWSPIMGVDLKYAINTNWDLFENEPAKTYYLRNENTWLRTSTLDGGWVPAGKLPESFSKLPADENWKEVKAAIPGKNLSMKDTPRVFLTREPAEMILLKGEPAYEEVKGTKLLWVSNTESDVFRMGKTGLVYYLVTGRWFSAPDFTGPWTFASTELPDDFQKISLEHPRSRVLASVPGTTQAAEAVLLAQVPETAKVLKTLKAPEVSYQGGMPEFETIKPTTVERAVNTDKDILKVGDLYYMCFQGVWFMSKTADGPWEVTGKVPKEIYEIPTSSPSHNVTYVYVEDDDDDAVVFATMAAYTGVMIAWGCAVWGTGYYYPPYVWHGGYYPIYYPRYPTYGYSAWYNPWTGAYGRGMGVYGPYGGAGVGARYNPATGTYARGAAAYGPYGTRAAASAYNPRTGAVGATRQGSNVYGSWGSTAVSRGDQWATTSRVTNNRTGNTTRVTQTNNGQAISRTGPDGSGFIGSNNQGDVYAGRDGNVYRNQGGSWQKYENGGWNNVEATPEQRQQAQERATQAQDRANQARSEAGGQAGSQLGQNSNRPTQLGSQTSGSQTSASQTSNRPAQFGTNTASTPRVDSSTMGQLNRDSAARAEGTQRTRDYSTVRSSPSTSSRSSGSYRPSGRSFGGGGRRR